MNNNFIGLETLFRLAARPEPDLNIFIRFSDLRLSLCYLVLCFFGLFDHVSTLVGKGPHFYLKLDFRV